MWGLRCLPHRTKGRSQCVALSFSLPPERHHCCRRRRSPPTCPHHAAAADVLRAAAGRGFRRLVSARRYRHDQSERRQAARQSLRHPAGFRQLDRRSATVSHGGRLTVSASATSSTTGSVPTSPVEYRGDATFSGTDFVTFRRGRRRLRRRTTISGSNPSWVVLVNAYVDLGTWWCMTPFVGAGVGTSRTTRSPASAMTASASAAGVGAALERRLSPPTASKWNFAWALHAGVAYKVTHNVTVELAYSYSTWATAITGADSSLRRHATPATSRSSSTNITSQDVRLGVRWTCCDSPPPSAAAADPKG